MRRVAFEIAPKTINDSNESEYKIVSSAVIKVVSAKARPNALVYYIWLLKVSKKSIAVIV